MFEKGYYLCKKNASTQSINEFIDTVFNNSARRNFSSEYEDCGDFTEGKLYYSQGGWKIKDNNGIFITFSKDSTAGFGYNFEKVDVDIKEIETLTNRINVKSPFCVKLYPQCIVHDEIYYACKITSRRDNLSILTTSHDPKTALYLAQKTFKERAVKVHYLNKIRT